MVRARRGAALATIGFVFLSLAGCISQPPNDAGGVREPLTSLDHAKIAFRPPTIVDPAIRGFEPGLAITSAGEIFYCSIVGFGRGSDLWRSTDGGATFQYIGDKLPVAGVPVRSVTGDLGGGDCDMTVDAGDRVYLVDSWLGSISVVSSKDSGETWTGTPLSIVGPPLDRPWALGGKTDEVWVSANQLGPTGVPAAGSATGVWVARSTDGGRTFPQQALAAGNGGRIELHSNVAADGDSLYIMVLRSAGEGQLAVMLASSSDRELNWREDVVAEQRYMADACGALVVFPVVAADSTGEVYLTWALQNAATGRVDLFFASSPDGGATWNAPIQLANRAGARAFPWMVAGDAGRVGIVWYETPVPTKSVFRPGDTGCRWENADNAEWFVHYALLENATSPNPKITEVLVQPAPAHIGELDRPYAERIDIEFDPQGRAAIGYVADVEGYPDARPMFVLQSEGPLGYER